jgi:hypothetical protein
MGLAWSESIPELPASAGRHQIGRELSLGCLPGPLNPRNAGVNPTAQWPRGHKG